MTPNAPGGWRRRLTASLALWLAVVVGASTAVWFVVNRAGRAVGSADAITAVTHPTTPLTTVDEPGTATSSSPAGSQTSTASGTTTPPLPTSATHRPTPTAQVIPVTGGSIAVACQASTMTWRVVKPKDGWSYVDKREGNALEVVFTSATGQASPHVLIRCRGGLPKVSYEAADDESHDSGNPPGHDDDLDD